jgi:hypothetical protein
MDLLVVRRQQLFESLSVPAAGRLEDYGVVT